MRYYSDLLEKTFDTVEELEKEESAKLELEKKLQVEKEKTATERKELAHQVEEAYKNYIEVLDINSKKLSELQAQINKENREASNKYLELRNEFIEKYGSFHMTYKDKTPKVEINEPVKQITFSDMFNDVFDLFKLLK